MKKLECMGVKHHAPVRIRSGPVSLIAHHRCAEVLHGHPNLLASAGFDGKFNQGGFR